MLSLPTDKSKMHFSHSRGMVGFKDTGCWFAAADACRAKWLSVAWRITQLYQDFQKKTARGVPVVSNFHLRFLFPFPFSKGWQLICTFWVWTMFTYDLELEAVALRVLVSIVSEPDCPSHSPKCCRSSLFIFLKKETRRVFTASLPSLPPSFRLHRLPLCPPPHFPLCVLGR